MERPAKRRRTSSISEEDVRFPQRSGEETRPRKKQLQRRSLFVRSLSSTTTTDSLIGHFSQSFPIRHATAVIDKKTNTCKGYGFITFADSEDTTKALEDFNGSTLNGRKIKLELAEPRHRETDESLSADIPGLPKSKSISVPSRTVLEARERKEQEQHVFQKSPKLIVRNLPWSINNSQQLTRIFQSYGKIKLATIPKKKGGLMYGFGFVILRGRQNCEKAIQGLNGKTIDGRAIAVDWAVDKEAWKGHHDEDTLPGSSKNDDMGNEGSHDDASSGEDSSLVDAEHSNMSSDSSLEQNDSLPNAHGTEPPQEADHTIRDRKTGQPSSSTLFIRNIPFECSDDALAKQFQQFGNVRYARVVQDSSTQKSRGTGFVCFFRESDAHDCLRRANNGRANQQASNLTFPSVLESDQNDPEGNFTMDGRTLLVSQAVDREEAGRRSKSNDGLHEQTQKDKRRLYLLSEGTISSGSQLHAQLSASEIAMREASAKQRKSLVANNPTLHISLTRLSVRNIPRSVTSKDLKALAREAVVGFAKDVQEGDREPLSKEELMRGGEEMKLAETMRKKKGVGLVKQAKIEFESKEGGKVSEASGAGKSRGYGFIEYHTHRSALMGLRWLNGQSVGSQTSKLVGKGELLPDAQDRKKRLIVEFAIENAQVVRRRRNREEQARTKQIPRPKNDGTKQSENHSLFDIVRMDEDANVKGESNGSGNTKAHQELKKQEKQTNRQKIIARKRASRRSKRKAAHT